MWASLIQHSSERIGTRNTYIEVKTPEHQYCISSETNGTGARNMYHFPQEAVEQFPHDNLLRIGELTQGPCPSIH